MAVSGTLRPSALQCGHSAAFVPSPVRLAFLAAGQAPPEMMQTNLPKAPLTLPLQLFLSSRKEVP
eukprot:7483166-Heterocapsa_arctica.AAC.1